MIPRLPVLPALSVALLVVIGCGGRRASPVEKPRPAATPPAASSSAARPAPYLYPAPVRGHFEEINTGTFDLVDGLAFPSTGREKGTVVYAVAKPIASPVLARSACPMTYARLLTAMRDAGWIEVTMEENGHSTYFAHGTPFGGSGREQDVGGRYWSGEWRPIEARAVGSVRHKDHGGFEFDLPLSRPRSAEVSESDRLQGRRGAESSRTPAEKEVVSAYEALHAAAAKKDLAAFLAAQGLEEGPIGAIRGLAGIEADFAAFADRFLTPGTTSEFQSDPGWGAIAGTGTNSKGAKFIDFYWFAPCGDRLVLTAISENPQ